MSTQADVQKTLNLGKRWTASTGLSSAVHGQFHDLVELLRTGGEVPSTSYIFMVRAFVSACVRACVHKCMRVFVHGRTRVIARARAPLCACTHANAAKFRATSCVRDHVCVRVFAPAPLLFCRWQIAE